MSSIICVAGFGAQGWISEQVGNIGDINFGGPQVEASLSGDADRRANELRDWTLQLK